MSLYEFRLIEGYQVSFVPSGVLLCNHGNWRIYMDCTCKKKGREGGGTILELQEKLASERMGNGAWYEIPDMATLMALQMRLERVRSLGEPFNRIEFSEEIQDVLEEMNSPLRHQEVV